LIVVFDYQEDDKMPYYALDEGMKSVVAAVVSQAGVKGKYHGKILEFDKVLKDHIDKDYVFMTKDLAGFILGVVDEFSFQGKMAVRVMAIRNALIEELSCAPSGKSLVRGVDKGGVGEKPVVSKPEVKPPAQRSKK
jgi:hypothetical protein